MKYNKVNYSNIDIVIEKLLKQITAYTKLDQFEKLNIPGYASLQSLIAKFENEMNMYKKTFKQYPKFKQVIRKTLLNIIDKYLGD